MRVCFLTPVLDAFKGGNHLPLLGAASDIAFTIVTGRTKPAHPDLPQNVTVETLNVRLGSYYYGMSDYLFARAVLKKHPASDPFWKQFDVIHLNQTMGPALAQLTKTGVPVCFLIHHPVTVDRMVAVEESPFLEALLWRAKYWLLARWQQRLCRIFPVLTVSQTAARRIADDYGCDPASIRIVPNGIDCDAFQPDPQTRFDVIAVGSFMHPRKGFRYLAEVYRLLSKRGYRIMDVGRRSDAQRQELASIPNVRASGMVNADELVRLMRQSAVLISTSLYEGFGLTLIEALACGRPAFAFDAGAVSEVLSPIDPDLVVPQKDTTELVRRASTFLSLTENERQRKGGHYVSRVRELYGLKKSAAALRSVYQDLRNSPVIS